MTLNGTHYRDYIIEISKLVVSLFYVLGTIVFLDC